MSAEEPELLSRVWVDAEGYVNRRERRRRREAGEVVGPRAAEDAFLYHGEDVSHIDMVPMSEGEALRRGLRPCSICFPSLAAMRTLPGASSRLPDLGAHRRVVFPPVLGDTNRGPWVRFDGSDGP